MKKTLLLAALLTGLSASAQTNIHSLAEYGPLGTPNQVKAAYEKAHQALDQTGGILVAPVEASKLYTEENTGQSSLRVPPFPQETKRWSTFGGPAVTVVQANENNTVIQVPPLGGLMLERTLRMPLTESLGHWTTDYALKIHNNIIHGSQSYLDWLQEPVAAGPDARFYVATIRGLRVGMFANGIGNKGVARLCIKSLGYDEQKKKHYFIADTSVPFNAGALIQNKSNEGVIWMEQETHADEQTYDIMLNRDKYGLGDTYMYFARFRYMGNNHSAAGDENANIFAAYTENLTANFNGKVADVDWTSNTVKFVANGRTAETLGASRPLINMNPNKWITKGKIIVVPAESYWDTIDTGKYPFEGKTYPTSVAKGKLRMGGLIRGDKDCPWDETIVGRWLAITDETERVWDGHASHRTDLLRWYQIEGFTNNADGTKEITIQRFWWGAKTMGSPTLYRPGNYTWDGHIRPLSYVIAPGTYVAEVSRAVPTSKGAKMENLLGVAPYREAKTAFDFEKGDAIEQAVGPDPFVPTGLRIWTFDGVPGAYPSPILDLANRSVTPRYAAMHVHGGAATLEGLTNSPCQRPAWDNIIVLDAAADVGLNWKADFANAAILFQQPNHEQSIKWLYGPREPAKPIAEATLTVGKDTGVFNFSGPISTPGLSADKTPARNLRGKNVAVPDKANSMTVAFPITEADGDYAVFVEQNWIGNRAITKKDAKGFTIQFEKSAPANAQLDWMIIR